MIRFHGNRVQMRRVKLIKEGETLPPLLFRLFSSASSLPPLLFQLFCPRLLEEAEETEEKTLSEEIRNTAETLPAFLEETEEKRKYAPTSEIIFGKIRYAFIFGILTAKLKTQFWHSDSSTETIVVCIHTSLETYSSETSWCKYCTVLHEYL